MRRKIIQNFESHSKMFIIVNKIYHKIIYGINNFFMFQTSLTNEKFLIFGPGKRIIYSKGKVSLFIQFYVQDSKIDIRKLQSTKMPSVPYINYKNVFLNTLNA